MKIQYQWYIPSYRPGESRCYCTLEPQKPPIQAPVKIQSRSSQVQSKSIQGPVLTRSIQFPSNSHPIAPTRPYCRARSPGQRISSGGRRRGSTLQTSIPVGEPLHPRCIAVEPLPAVPLVIVGGGRCETSILPLSQERPNPVGELRSSGIHHKPHRPPAVWRESGPGLELRQRQPHDHQPECLGCVLPCLLEEMAPPREESQTKPSARAAPNHSGNSVPQHNWHDRKNSPTFHVKSSTRTRGTRGDQKNARGTSGGNLVLSLRVPVHYYLSRPHRSYLSRKRPTARPGLLTTFVRCAGRLLGGGREASTSRKRRVRNAQRALVLAVRRWILQSRR